MSTHESEILHEVILVRHGETTGESSIRLNGATDVPLSEHGRAQMRAVAAELVARGWTAFDRVLVSPLCRSRESAELAMPGARLTEVPGFAELNFGRWERLTYAEVRDRDLALYNEMTAGAAEFQFPEGESRQAFFARVRLATHQWLDGREQTLPGRRTLVVVHKGTIKGITATLLGNLEWAATRAEPCDLGSIHRFELREIDGRRQFVRALHNGTAHLGPLWMADHPARPVLEASTSAVGLLPTGDALSIAHPTEELGGSRNGRSHA